MRKSNFLRPAGLALALFFFRNLCGQGLAELAEQEKQRRQSITGAVRIRIESISQAVGKDQGSAPAKATRDRPSSRQGQEKTAREIPAPDEKSSRRRSLSLRGPLLRQEIREERKNLEDQERQLAEARRRYLPSLRRGVPVEDPQIRLRIRDLERSREKVQRLQQEWRRLEEEVRQSGWPPGLLRGQLP